MDSFSINFELRIRIVFLGQPIHKALISARSCADIKLNISFVHCVCVCVCVYCLYAYGQMRKKKHSIHAYKIASLAPV